MEEQCAGFGCIVAESRVVGDAVEMISGIWEACAEGAKSLLDEFEVSSYYTIYLWGLFK